MPPNATTLAGYGINESRTSRGTSAAKTKPAANIEQTKN